MKKILLLTPLLMFLPTKALASSTATVNIHNSVSGNSTSQVSSHTNVTVETDGNVTHYESDEPGDVHVESVNGESKITVNGKEVTSSPTNSGQAPTVSPTPKPTSVDKNIEEEEQKVRKGFVEMLKAKFSFLEKFFSLFHR